MADVERVSVSDNHAKAGEVMSDQSPERKSRNDNIEQLKALWAEGKASAAATAVDFDNLLDEARQEAKTIG